MLNEAALKNKIKSIMTKYLIPAIVEIEKARHPELNKSNIELAQQVGEIFNDSVIDAFSTYMASIIHNYILSISITGIIQTKTLSGPLLHTCDIEGPPIFFQAGGIIFPWPNRLWIY